MVSAGHVGGTHGSGIVSSVVDVLWMSVVRGMRGVGEVCEMCICLLTRGGVGTGGVLDVCLGCGGVGDVGGEWVWGLDQSMEGGVLLCMCKM